MYDYNDNNNILNEGKDNFAFLDENDLDVGVAVGNGNINVDVNFTITFEDIFRGKLEKKERKIVIHDFCFGFIFFS